MIVARRKAQWIAVDKPRTKKTARTKRNFEKAYILGKVFCGYIRNEIDYTTFLKLATTIDRALIDDLKNLDTYYFKIKSHDIKLGVRKFKEIVDDATCQSLYNAGLVRREGYSAVMYYTNELGSCLLKLLSK